MVDGSPSDTSASDVPGSLPDSPVEVSGRVDRAQSTWGLIAVGVATLALMFWLLSGRTPANEDPVAVDETEITPELESIPDEVEPVPDDDQPAAGAAVEESESSLTNATVGAPTAALGSQLSTTIGPLGGNLAIPGWRLVVGDGHNVLMIDLDSGDHQRHTAVGAPLTAVGDRLLFYQNSQLFWLVADQLALDPEFGSEPLAGVPTLQVMFVRPRLPDRPVVVNKDSPTEAAIWWPNNNSNPQRWLKVGLADGSRMDELSLSNEVFGGPEVVATLGSGSFERVEGEWESLEDMFASSYSETAVLGRQCDSPDRCQLVVVDRRNGEMRPVAFEGVDVTEAVLVADADRLLLVTSDGLLDLELGRLTALPNLEADNLVVSSGSLVAAATQVSVGEKMATILLADLDQGQQSRFVVDLVPRWLVLVPPE